MKYWALILLFIVSLGVAPVYADDDGGSSGHCNPSCQPDDPDGDSNEGDPEGGEDGEEGGDPGDGSVF